MEKRHCSTCNKKTPKECGLCEAPTCKTCAHNIGDDFFEFLKKIPDELSHGYYCNTCFVNTVSSEYESYKDILERATGMDVYFKKKHSKEVRFFRKASKTIVLKDCEDYEHMILNMAFLAAAENYNTIIQVETSSRKIHDGSYKIILWSGSAIPANKNHYACDDEH